ncbi:hypothetical protein [Aeromonas veronii]|uniref:hypothetical protein n=1 Tax=Aeromonas veronii TaxID=654 RepID=UPI003D260A11
MTLSRDQVEIIELAKQIIRLSPGTTPQKALRHALDIQRQREHYRVSSEDKGDKNEKTAWTDLPEHVRATINRQKKAAEMRKKQGLSLPGWHKVSGGKVSPK